MLTGEEGPACRRLVWFGVVMDFVYYHGCITKSADRPKAPNQRATVKDISLDILNLAALCSKNDRGPLRSNALDFSCLSIEE